MVYIMVKVKSKRATLSVLWYRAVCVIVSVEAVETFVRRFLSGTLTHESKPEAGHRKSLVKV